MRERSKEDLDVSRPSHCTWSGSVDDRTRRRQAKYQEDEEEQQEQASEQLRDRERRAGDRREPQKRRQKSDHEKHQSHVQHATNPPPLVIAKGMPGYMVEAVAQAPDTQARRPREITDDRAGCRRDK